MTSPRLRSARLAVAVACLCVSSLAGGEPTLWERATADPEAVARQERYQLDLQLGLEQARAVLEESHEASAPMSASRRTLAVQEALRAFARAAQARPEAPDPHYYRAVVGYLAQLECSNCLFDAAVAREVVEALEAFEERAPQDPRLGALLSERAILRTRLAGAVTGAASRRYLEGAAADYRAIIDRNRYNWEQTYGNLAEVYMMLGDLEAAIATYRLAQRSIASASLVLGLAVALDRDERSAEARALVRELSEDAIAMWEADVARGFTFYVPAGEVHYYRGLIAEARGDRTAAIAAYLQFENSGAHPQFAARSRAHRAALAKTGPR